MAPPLRTVKRAGAGVHLPAHWLETLFDYCLRAPSTAAITSGDSGVTLGSKRATGLPLRSKRNLVKFHLISPPSFGSVDLSVRKTYSGVLSSPTTDTLAIIGKLTLYLLLQNFLISSLVPGSWLAKLFAGMPTITRPWSLYFS